MAYSRAMAHSINDRIAARVRGELAARNISHSTYAAAIGVPERTIARRLAGNSSWTADEVADSADYLNLTIPDLIAGWQSSQTRAVS